jgi:OOP family OmpA-OmpF porin
MKKLFIALFFACASVTGMAQNADITEKYSVATNSFWSNWFIQGGVTWEAWYGNYEDGMGFSKNPFKAFRSNPGFSIGIGKWFTPGLGLRTKFQGVWGKSVWNDENIDTDNKYWILREDVLFNLSNLFCGYNEDRVWNFIPFIGGGLGRSCTYNDYAVGFTLGILNEFWVNKRLAINFEIGWNRYESSLCGMPADYGEGIMSHPNHVYAEVGVTFNLGKTRWKKVPDVDAIKALSQSQIDALNAQLADEKAENERLKNELANKKTEPTVKVEKEYVTNPVSVFFNIDKADIASKKDLVNVKNLADYSKDNDAKLIVTGYADSATGSAEYNRELSQKRAETVADELVNMGVKRENIQIVANGGVDTLVPPSYNRRATVELAK